MNLDDDDLLEPDLTVLPECPRCGTHVRVAASPEDFREELELAGVAAVAQAVGLPHNAVRAIAIRLGLKPSTLPMRRGRKRVPFDTAQFRELVRTGSTEREIARHFGHSSKWVHRAKRELGLIGMTPNDFTTQPRRAA